MVSWPVVVKVGGSLFSLADLGPRLRRLLAEMSEPVLIVPGGGPAADCVRLLDRMHGLGEEASHWLALRGLTLNAHFLAALLNPAPVIQHPATVARLSDQPAIAILDGHAFVCRDESEHPELALPHCWTATSDSLAVRVAAVAGARRLYLLKSLTIPARTAWTEAAQLGWVDELFPALVDQTGSSLAIHSLNLREVN